MNTLSKLNALHGYLLFLTLFISVTCKSQDEFPTLTGPYMGQKLPGAIAEPFAPGVISKAGWEVDAVFSPNLKEFYFAVDRGQIIGKNDTKFKPTYVGFKQENNIWKKSFEFKRKGELTFSPDGKRMHMAKSYKDRIGAEWSETKKLDPMFNRKEWGIMRLTSSTQGTYVFDDFKSKVGLRISTIKEGKRQSTSIMPAIINAGKKTAHPFIAPDESYLIWDSERKGGFGSSDLYISFKQKDGSWGSPINMGKNINSAKSDTFASVTADGKYILFNRKISDENFNVDIYWADAQIIETLRAKQ